MKQKSEHDGRFPILKQRLIELQGNKTHEEFAQEIGITRQTMGFYLRGERIPDSETLAQICTRRNVSADWLLGLSDVRSTDTQIRDICDYTGLSERTISVLHSESQNPANPLEEVNRLFERFESIHGLICEISTAMKAIRKRDQKGRIDPPLPHDIAAVLGQWEMEFGGVALDYRRAAEWHADHAGNMLRDLITKAANQSVSPSFTEQLALYDVDLPDDPDAQEYDSGEEGE